MDSVCNKCKLLSTSLQLRWMEGSSYWLTHLECGCESMVQFESDDIRCLFEEGWVDSLILNLTIRHPSQSNTKGLGDFAGIWGIF